MRKLNIAPILSQTISYQNTMDPNPFESLTRRSHPSQDHDHTHILERKPPNTPSTSMPMSRLNRTIHVDKPTTHLRRHQNKPSFIESQSMSIEYKKRPLSSYTKSLKRQLNSAGISGCTQLFDGQFEETFSKFNKINWNRPTPKKIPLSFLRPHSKFSMGKSMEQVKTLLYDQLQRVPHYKVPQGKIIEYVTDYKQPYKMDPDSRLMVYKPKKCQNPSFLRQKLKNKVKQQSTRYQEALQQIQIPSRKQKKISIVSI